MEMADSVAYQHTDGYRNHDGSYELHGIKSRKMGLPKCLVVSFYVLTFDLVLSLLAR